MAWLWLTGKGAPASSEVQWRTWLCVRGASPPASASHCCGSSAVQPLPAPQQNGLAKAVGSTRRDRADRSGGTLGTLRRLRKGGQTHRNSGFASSLDPAVPILKCNVELGRLRAAHVSNLVRNGLAWPMPSVRSTAPVASACWPVYHNHSKRTYGEGDAREGPRRSGRVGSTTQGKRTGRGTI